MKKLISLVLAIMMVAMVGLAFAQTVGTPADGKGSITISNAAKGETYGVVKLFDATVGENGEIAYTGTVPDALKAYFEEDAAHNVTLKAGVDDKAVTDAVAAWAKSQTAVASVVSDGSKLTFEGLDYGYYAVTSTQGALVTIDSTNPVVTVVDKNSKEPSANKTVDKQSYSIGDTITYTSTFNTANYLGDKQVTKYVISDTLPEFLSDVTVTGITVGGTAIETQQFVEKKITIPWVTGEKPNYTSLYSNGAVIVITYTAKLTDVTNFNADDTNTVTLKPYVYNPGPSSGDDDDEGDDDDDDDKPWSEDYSSDAKIKTYAAALIKVDKDDNPLAGAQFTIKGLTVTGSNGVYTVVSYDPSAEATESATLDTDADGKLYILGLAQNVTLTVTEVKAPDGYNKLTETKTLNPQVLSEKIIKESGTINYDSKGNVTSSTSSTTSVEETKNLDKLDAQALKIVNQAGAELPSTGGMGTTILYIVGAMLIVGAGVILVTRRKAASK